MVAPFPWTLVAPPRLLLSRVVGVVGAHQPEGQNAFMNMEGSTLQWGFACQAGPSLGQGTFIVALIAFILWQAWSPPWVVWQPPPHRARPNAQPSL